MTFMAEQNPVFVRIVTTSVTFGINMMSLNLLAATTNHASLGIFVEELTTK